MIGLRRMVAMIGLPLLACAFAFGGREMAQAAAPTPRPLGTVSAFSGQLLGAGRSFPLIALWQRVERAKANGQWAELTTLYDLIEKLTPNNPSVSYWQAYHEAVSISRDQPTRRRAWMWGERGLRRLKDASKRLPDTSVIDQGVWDIGYALSDRFPLEYARVMALQGRVKLDIEMLEHLQETLEADGAAIDVLERTGLDEPPEGDMARRDLPPSSQLLLNGCDSVRFRALVAVSGQALAKNRAISGSLLLRYLYSLRRLHALSESPVEQEDVRLLAARGIARELERVKAAGYPERARDIEENMLTLFGDWLFAAAGDASASAQEAR